MQYINKTVLFLLLASFSMAANASVATWDFKWERTARSNTFTGIGMFSYLGTAGDLITHGRSKKYGDLDDELVEFSFEGFVNEISVGATHTLPKLFVFSPDDDSILALRANVSGPGVGIRCRDKRCSIREDGERIRRSGGQVHVTERDHRGGGSTTSLSEPGLFGLTAIAMFLSLWYRRRGRQAAASIRLER